MKEIILSNRFLKLVVLPYGGIIKELWYDGINVVLGNNDSEKYLKNPWYLGACIGRYAGRLSSGYTIDNEAYSIDHKDGIQLHGGASGWDKVIWKVVDIFHGNNPQIILEHECSEQNGSGHPGNIKTSIKYCLHESSILFEYKASTNKTCPVNITNHSYFNLSGAPNLGDHELLINSTKTLDLDDNLLPTGKFVEVSGTDFDFKRMKALGYSRYDDCFVLDNNNDINVSLRALTTKIQMDVVTDQPGIVVFNPKELNGIALETQKFSNAPNISHFPNTILHPGEKYIQKTKYSFSNFKSSI